MQPPKCNPAGARRAFTLIELLVVIAIIAILAALLVPTLAGVKARAKKARAKVEIGRLAAAIKLFESDNSMAPVSKMVWKCSAANPDSDFTFGTTWRDGTLLKAGYPSIVSYGLSSVSGSERYENCNAEVIAILRSKDMSPTPELQALSTTNNPKQITYFHETSGGLTNAPGIGPDGVYRDPWNNPYIISLDLNLNGKTIDGFYGALRKKSLGIADVKAEIMVWSFGPDGQADSSASTGLKGGANKDNVCSWEL